MKYAMLFFLLAALPSAAHAQRPTVDDDGNQVFRESKSPVEWADPGGYGYKVAMDKAAPILRGEKYDDGNDIVSSSFEESWSNILLVADWTGSMYDYAPQALRWHLDNRSRVPIRHLVLFNDGDGKNTSQKESGMEDYLKIACETGGSVAYDSGRVDFSKEKPLAAAFGRYTWKRQEDGDWRIQAGQ